MEVIPRDNSGEKEQENQDEGWAGGGKVSKSVFSAGSVFILLSPGSLGEQVAPHSWSPFEAREGSLLYPKQVCHWP